MLSKTMTKTHKIPNYEQTLLKSIKAIAGDQTEQIIKLSKSRGGGSFGSFEFYVALYLELLVGGEKLEDLEN